MRKGTLTPSNSNDYGYEYLGKCYCKKDVIISIDNSGDVFIKDVEYEYYKGGLNSLDSYLVYDPVLRKGRWFLLYDIVDDYYKYFYEYFLKIK